MNTNTTKKGLLATGLAVLSAAITLLVNGRDVEGAILAAFGIGLVVAYDYLDDKLKSPPKLPDEVDAQTFQQFAAFLAAEVNQRTDTEDSRDTDE